jgi:hypothetical protein
MDRSPKGREIERVEGNPGDIISRGEAIADLGDKMLDCADTLETIKNEAVGDGSQKGKAIEKLKEAIGDSHDKLREAGDLYQPVGPVIRTYGNELDSCQPVINNSADDCETKWATYDSLPGDRDGSTTPEAGGGILGVGGYDKDSPEAKEKAQDNAAKAAAYEDWLESAEAFDGGYDTWENAFDTACDNIGDAMAGSIKDSFWDNISDVVSVLTEILSWAALIIGVIAIFFGGFLVLAAILAVAAFLLTAIQFAAGEKSGWDLAFAALAIIPVGKLTNLTKLAQFPKLAKGAGGVANAASRTWKALSKWPINTIVTRGGDDALRVLSRSKIKENLIGPTLQQARKGNIGMYVGNRDLFIQQLPRIRVYNRVDQVASVASTWAGHYGRAGTVFGPFNIELPAIPKPIKAAL